MLLPGTQMHLATFIFVCIEIVIFFYLLIYRLARPDDKKTYLNIILIALLIFYNVTGGLLPDPNLPGSFFFQISIAYATGFITPCFFPYYVVHAFGLEKMKFHAYRGVYLFLILPYISFITAFGISNNLEMAKNLLILPVLYAIWVVISLVKAIRFKYGNLLRNKESKEESTVLLLSITPWVGLPVIDYYNLGQAAEASFTNIGFLLLLALQVKRHIREMRKEHQMLIDSEKRLLEWNSDLQKEVQKRTKALQESNEQRMLTFVNLAHETRTPLTLINNYLDEYLDKNENSPELSVIKKGIDKLSRDIINLFDLQKLDKGLNSYNHNLLTDFSEAINSCLVLFQKYAAKRNIILSANIQNGVVVMADPLSINRIINNLLENAIKFSSDGGRIEIALKSSGDQIEFSVKDDGPGIAPTMHKKVFEPYFQIGQYKNNNQGMGLGLPITKQVIEDLGGTIQIISNQDKEKGCLITVWLTRHLATEETQPAIAGNNSFITLDNFEMQEQIYCDTKQTVLLVEDNVIMLKYLHSRLLEKYNVYTSLNGQAAMQILKNIPVLPDLIITDVMMDKMDGFSFAKTISAHNKYKLVPFIFLTARSKNELQGLKLGAIDYIQKPFSIQILLQKIESILRNAEKQKNLFINSVLSLKNRVDFTNNDSHRDFEQNCELYRMTSRERDIARLICRGQRYREIGETLFISEKTVTKHVQNIFEKLDVSNKIELIKKLEINFRSAS